MDSLRREIERSLSTLSERQSDVVKLYFGIGVEHPMSLEDIGAEFDLTREIYLPILLFLVLIILSFTIKNKFFNGTN